MNLSALLLLTAVGAACINQRVDALTIDQIIGLLMGGSPPYWKVIFDVDSSGSINTTEWYYSKQATLDTLFIIDNTPAADSVHPIRHRIGLVRFSDEDVTKVIFGLGTYGLFSQNYMAIASVPKKDSYAPPFGSWNMKGIQTNTKKGLQLCQNELGVQGKRLVWMTTDGKSNQGGNPVPKANAMKSTGIVICVVAVGPDTNMTEINDMASWLWIPGYIKPKRCVLEFESFQAYKTAARAARNRVVPARRNRRIK